MLAARPGIPERGWVRALSGEGRRLEYGTVMTGCSLPKLVSSGDALSVVSTAAVSTLTCMTDSRRLVRRFRVGCGTTHQDLTRKGVLIEWTGRRGNAGPAVLTPSSGACLQRASTARG